MNSIKELSYVWQTYIIALIHRYGDLLALAEDFEDVKTTRVLRAVPSRRASAAAANAKSSNSNNKKKLGADESDTSEESSDVSSKSTDFYIMVIVVQRFLNGNVFP